MTVPATALLAEIRLAFWSEALEGLLAGASSTHPALRALEGAPEALLRPLPAAVEARRRELEARPFKDLGALFAHMDAADEPFVAAGAGLLAAGARPAALGAGRALGLLRLLKTRAAQSARGRDPTPKELDPADAGLPWRGAAATALGALRRVQTSYPDAAFPVLAPAALLPAYARGLRPSPLGARARLLIAALRGRV